MIIEREGFFVVNLLETDAVVKLNRLNNRGFTLIELLMVILVIGILAAIGITQFVDFAKDSRNSALKANLQVLRRGISAQNGMMRIRCGVQSASFPPLANVQANDISNGDTPCLASVVTTPDNSFVSGGLPENPWSANPGSANASAVYDGTSGYSATPSSRDTCDSGYDGWCYDEATGTIWANSKRNDGANSNTGNETSY